MVRYREEAFEEGVFRGESERMSQLAESERILRDVGVPNPDDLGVPNPDDLGLMLALE